MNHAVTLAHSAQYLKKAIPLLIKNKMPVTPINYALWYSYVVGNHPQLNVELDAIIEKESTCSQEQAKVLFDTHLSTEDLAYFQKISEKFETTIHQMQHDISYTLDRSKSFATALVDSQNELTQLSSEQSFDEILGCVERLTDESIEMQDCAREFQTKLALAYNEIKELKEALNLSQKAADTDQLTDFYNRRKFDADITKFCAEVSAQPNDNRLAVLIMFDIDHFKRFNDEFGHQKGDEVLKLVAKRVKKNTPDTVKVYRYGGEEFCITGYFDAINDVMAFSERIRLDIAKLSVRKKVDSSSKRAISASFGIALMRPFSNSNVLIERADRALYLAKTHGRNRIEIAPDI
ncbi:GGDEF domain-containing protein [Pseudoalteromonas sp. MMG010]|uniref:GGDEF domain-containing protein n=1 Tax=Pseudoalteromonas sp. MMG010 TaxID=2822685 RepID=UPI001B3A67FA|nr:GGDEF domain-containing protein [Pseudoalteromonas sp. MMG010]MBQ4831730.1 GGDEF domain-containing protein [Pseudoalteromonas sp. MMG010]